MGATCGAVLDWWALNLHVCVWGMIIVILMPKARGPVGQCFCASRLLRCWFHENRRQKAKLLIFHCAVVFLMFVC